MRVSNYSAYQQDLHNQGRPSRPLSAARMGTGRRVLAFLVIVAGISTFFMPFVTTDPAVIGRTQWSVWNIAMKVHEGQLPHPTTGGVGYIPIDTTCAYLTLLAALVAILVFPDPRLIAAVGLLGSLQGLHAYAWDGDKWRLEHMFYGKTWGSPDSIGHVGFHQLTTSLLVATVALFLVSLDAISDPPARNSG